MLYRIWSFQHNKWKSEIREYTTDVALAGVYVKSRAAEIVENSLGEEVALIFEKESVDLGLVPDVIVFSESNVSGAMNELHDL